MRVIVCLAAALIASPALAQTAPTPPDAIDISEQMGRDSITIGGGVVRLPDYEGSDEYRLTPAPGAIGSIKGFSFQLAGNRLSVDLIPRTTSAIDIQAGPIGVVNLNRRNVDNVDERGVRALGDLGTAIELGGFVGIAKTGIITSPYDTLGVSLSYRTDVNGVHGSGIWQPSINYLTPLSRKAAVALFATAEHAGDGYARTYFGVTQAGSVASGLRRFDADGGWKNWSVGTVATYSLTGDLFKGFKLVAGGTYGRLLGDFADSPLVSTLGSRSQWLGALGLAYTF
jgi:outer membrane scaffolding protein for murein synthesis (MipA/OmpV family)